MLHGYLETMATQTDNKDQQTYTSGEISELD